MILYIDSSVVVSALTFEAASPRVQLWLEMQEPDTLHLTLWVQTEFSSALSLKVRTGALTPALRESCLGGIATLKDEALTIVPVKPKQFVPAARLVDASPLGLRAADALHLAVSMDVGATLCTLDQRIADAAKSTGAEVLTP